MIRYSLKCAGGHRFDSWFGSADAFDTLVAAGQLHCPECGSGRVEKAPMAPGLSAGSKTAAHPLARLRKKIETEAEYVGGGFAAEARAIHDGAAPERPIWGEARIGEARALAEDGVPVSPLPFRPSSKMN